MILKILGVLFLLLICYFFVGTPPQKKKIAWGVNFSQKQTRLLGIDDKETYLALLDDLKVRDLKLIAHWDLLEPREDEYSFQDLDWQIQKAQERGVKIILVIGMKTGRWPECHIPQWARGSKNELQRSLLRYIRLVVNRYKNSKAIWAWQVENEPFFPFGKCPTLDKNFLQREVNLVRSLDSKRPIIISDSGEGSLWWKAARIGDIIGTTMYKRVWFEQLRRYVTYPFPPIFYWRKYQIIKRIFGKKVICIELQAEPWGPVLLSDLPLEEQTKTMNLKQFRYNIDFARRTGFDRFYLWGGEWWYWLKIKQNDPSIWEEARKLF